MLSPEEAARRREEAAVAVRDAHFAAKAHTPEAIAVLVHLMRKGDNQTIQLSAANSVLDRGLGRAPQAMALDLVVRKQITAYTDAELADLCDKLTGNSVPVIDLKPEPVEP